MLISKDLEEMYKFPVINIRLKSMFTKNYINLPISIEEEFTSKFGFSRKKIDDVTRRIIPTNYYKHRCSGASPPSH